MMRYSAILIAACSVLLFSMAACTSSPANSSTEIDSEKELEAIYGFEVAADKLTFLVKSNNCTDAKHFAMNVESTSTATTYHISLVRNKPDRCRAMSRLIEISMSLKTPLPDGATVRLKNPITVSARLKRVPASDT